MFKIFQLTLPLPFKPDIIHTYILQSKEYPEKLILIDAGVNTDESLGEVSKGIKNIDDRLSIENIEWIIITHAHVDHIGGLKKLKLLSSAKIIMHTEEYKFLSGDTSYHWINNTVEYGLTESFINLAKPAIKMYRNFVDQFIPDILLQGNSGPIPILDDSLSYIKIPGHTPAHIAVFENKSRSIFTGDTILSTISPNLGFSGWKSNPIKEYIESLNELKNGFTGWIAYPSHQDIIYDIEKRINEILDFQKFRLDRIKDYFHNGDKKTLKEAVLTIYDDVWDKLDQRFLAIMETIAYLKYFKIKSLE